MGQSGGSYVIRAAVLVAGAFALSACAGEPPASTQTSAQSSSPALNLTPTATPTPTLTPTPTPTPVAVAVDDIYTWTAEEAKVVCLANMAENTEAVARGMPETFERTIAPRWLVVIPAENPNGHSFIHCLIGTDVHDPWNSGVGEIAAELMSDEFIEELLHNNEGL